MQAAPSPGTSGTGPGSSFRGLLLLGRGSRLRLRCLSDALLCGLLCASGRWTSKDFFLHGLLQRLVIPLARPSSRYYPPRQHVSCIQLCEPSDRSHTRIEHNNAHSNNASQASPRILYGLTRLQAVFHRVCVCVSIVRPDWHSCQPTNAGAEHNDIQMRLTETNDMSGRGQLEDP